MVPLDHTYSRPNQTSTTQGTPFQVADGDWGNSFSGDDSDTQLVRSHLTRRSKSVTDADLSELLSETRRPSFFSRRKQKAPEQAAASSSLSGNRSFSGQLPSKVDSKPANGSKQTGSKSFKVRGEQEVETSKPKSGKWWSWGSSSKAPKPDSKVSSTSNSESISSSSRPNSLELPQQSQVSITASAAEQAQLAQLSPAMTGCMSLFSANPQQERPVSEVQWTGAIDMQGVHTQQAIAYIVLCFACHDRLYVPFVCQPPAREACCRGPVGRYSDFSCS